MTTTIQRWGNSLALRIPKSYAHDARLSKGTAVDIKVDHGRLVIKPSKPARESLAALLKGVTPANLHGDALEGKAVGREVW